MLPFPVQTLASQSAAGTLYTTYTTAKTVINQSELVTIPGAYMKAGTKFRVKAYGGISNIVTTPGTVVLQVMMGATAVFTTGTLQMTTTANTLAPFLFEVTMRLDSASITAGSTATAAKFMGVGLFAALDLTIGSGANPTVTDTAVVVPVTAPAVGTGFDSSVANILDFWAGFSISNAGNGIQLYDYTVEQLA